MSSDGAVHPSALLEIEFTDQGYLHVPAEVAQQYFPNDVLVVVVKGKEMWLMPMRGAGGGGLFLKQRNSHGDRSVVIWEVLPTGTPLGKHAAFWDAEHGALRVALDKDG